MCQKYFFRNVSFFMQKSGKIIFESRKNQGILIGLSSENPGVICNLGTREAAGVARQLGWVAHSSKSHTAVVIVVVHVVVHRHPPAPLKQWSMDGRSTLSWARLFENEQRKQILCSVLRFSFRLGVTHLYIYFGFLALRVRVFICCKSGSGNCQEVCAGIAAMNRWVLLLGFLKCSWFASW